MARHHLGVPMLLAAIPSLAILYLGIVAIFAVIPSPNMLDEDGELDTGRLFGYSAAVVGIGAGIALLISVIGAFAAPCYKKHR